MSFERNPVYTLICDVTISRAGRVHKGRHPALCTPEHPYRQDFKPSYDGVRGARALAKKAGWSREVSPEGTSLDVCPICDGGGLIGGTGTVGDES